MNLTRLPDACYTSAKRRKESWAAHNPLALFALFLILNGGCVTTGTPSSNELQQISAVQKVVLLLRITLDVDGKRSDPFSSNSPDGNVNLAYLGSTINKRIETYRFPSEEAREAGWIYLIENPGTYYMAVQPPRGSETPLVFILSLGLLPDGESMP